MLLAILYWKDERSFDNFHQHNPNLYRITTTMVDKDGNQATTGGTGQVQGPAFKSEVPEIKDYVRIWGGGIYNNVVAEDKTLSLQTFFVDHNFFEVFSFELLRGDPNSALADVASIVITESTARKFYNSIDVVGKLLKIDGDPSFKRLGKPMMISGVVQDPPPNSSLRFDALFTFKFMHLSFEDTNWLNEYLGTFVVLHPGADKQAVLSKFKKSYELHSKDQLNESYKTYGFNPKISYGLQPITDIHLNPLMSATGNAEGGVINGSRPVYSYMFLGVALFILLMAAINFINISIGNSLKRAKEVGVRKIAGGNKWQIILQFLNKSAILCLFAFMVSVALTNFALPLFNDLSGKQLRFITAVDGQLIAYLLLLLSIIILSTGLYPALILSNFKPAEVLYNKQKLSGKNMLGRSLVVVQFSLAVFLLLATMVYYQQMDYIRTKDLGYNPNQVLRTNVFGDRDYKSVMPFLKNELTKEPSITTISFGNDGWPEDMEVDQHHFSAQYKNIDENFLSALEIPLLNGRNLSATPTDIKEGAIVNEAFVKAARLEDPIGKTLMVNRHYDSSFKVIKGVVKDFHFGSLRERIKPMMMYMSETPDGGIWVKFKKTKQKEAIAATEQAYKKAIPASIYNYNFLDELNAQQYIQEQRWQQVINIATILSFIICCLGLFGLAHLSTHQRIKEIGIRKVLGASAGTIVALLSKDFLKLVAIAAVIAFPMAWYGMHKWLEDFAYRVSISWWAFVLAVLLAAIIALATISFQAIKAALANPVKSLRSE